MNNLTTMEKKNVEMPVNPLINKLRSVYDVGDTSATYQGIFIKSLFFMIMVMAGVLLAVAFTASGAITVDSVTGELNVARHVIMLLLVAAGIFVVFPFVAFLVRVTIPVTGSLYCASVGYLFGFFAMLDTELGAYILLALVLTLSVVGVMGFLFAKGIIRVTLKFRAVSTSLFFAVVIGSLLMLVCSFVPFLRECILQLISNPVVAMLSSAFGMVVAILFLLVDFESIRTIVEDELPKEYEWYASFGLIFAVVWVYLKILHLILQATDKK